MTYVLTWKLRELEDIFKDEFDYEEDALEVFDIMNKDNVQWIMLTMEEVLKYEEISNASI